MFGLHGLSISGRLLGNIGSVEEWLLLHNVKFNGFFHNGVFGSSDPYVGIVWIVVLLIIATKFPNTIQFMQKFQPRSDNYKYKEVNIEHKLIGWKMTTLWAIVIGIGLCIAIASITKTSEFLYFQF